MPQPRFVRVGSDLGLSAVDEEFGASDEAGVVGDEEDGAGDVLSITLLQFTYAAIKSARRHLFLMHRDPLPQPHAPSLEKPIHVCSPDSF